MHFPLLLNALMAGFLGGGPTSPPSTAVCVESPPVFLRVTQETVWPSSPGTSAKVTAFIDVAVVPMDQERVLVHQTVLVEDGRITAIGPAATVQVPTGAVRIDGRGKFLIPGLANMHVHDNFRREALLQKASEKLFTQLATGVTTIRTLDGPYVDPKNPDIHQRNQLQHTFEKMFNGMFPRVFLASGIPVKIKPESVSVYVAAARAAGYTRIATPFVWGTGPDRDRPVFDSLIAAARRVGLQVSIHSHRFPFDAVLASGTTGGGSVEHISAVFWDTLGLWDSYLPQPHPPTSIPLSRIPPLAAAVQRAGVWITPTLDCMERRHTHMTGMPQVVKALHDAGVGLLLSGDDGGDVHDELVALVRAGLTPYQALLTGTRQVAQYFGTLDSSGTVAVGKRADLVLLGGNPLVDIWNTREPVGVMINGQWLDRATLDRELLMRQTTWFKMAVERPYPGITQAQRQQLQGHIRTYLALANSADDAKATPPERRLQPLADALGAARAVLTAEQQRLFDPFIRVWLREQVRQGHQVTIPGLTVVSPLVLTHVTVVDVASGQLLNDQTVVVIGQRIHALGPTGQITLPAGAQVVDASGKYLMPGLWDMHCHPMRHPDVFYPLLIANGVTGIRDAGTPVPIDTVRQWQHEIAVGARVGPRQVIAGRALDYQEHNPDLVGVTTPIRAQRVVDSMHAAGADFIKVHEVTPTVYFAIAAAARRLGMPFGGHVPGYPGIGPPDADAMSAIVASDSGASVLDHRHGMDGACMGDSASLESCTAIAARLKQNGTWVVPTLLVIGARAKPRTRYVLHVQAQKYWPDSIFSHKNKNRGDSAIADQDVPVPAKLRLDLMQRAGMPLLAGTDAAPTAFLSFSGLVPGFSLQEEVIAMVWAGLTPLNALQAATLNPAKLLHATDSLGTVAVGKLADLVLLDANPLTDIHNIIRVRAVVANGRYFDRVALDTLLTTVARAAQGDQTHP